MQIIVSKNLTQFVRFTALPKLISSQNFRLELHRGVIDAGRKTRTQVQKAVAQQMAVTAGGYRGYVVPNMRGISRPADLSFEIKGTGKGSPIETYKGLRALAPKGRVAKAMNKGRSAIDRGFVRSGVWNSPRTFKRSFVQGGMFLALVPGGQSGRLPKALWTFGHKPLQPRDAMGRFSKSGQPGFKIRKLYGPALGKELDKDQSLQTFLTFGPAELEVQVAKRVARLMKW